MSPADGSACRPRRLQHGSRYYLWDSRVIDTIDDALFDPAAWARNGALAGEAGGRGTAYFLQRDNGDQWVLRHSRRGGAAARLSNDRYVWLGLRRCRVIREWHLLAEMRSRELPVPAPVAARVIRSGPVYRGDLITGRVPAARPLSDRLARQALSDTVWEAIGAAVARLHRAGVDHHDLNARNILVGDDGAVTLIDFDKSRLRAPGRWCEQNTARLRRSLDKFAGQNPDLHFSEADWHAFQRGLR